MGAGGCEVILRKATGGAEYLAEQLASSLDHGRSWTIWPIDSRAFDAGKEGEFRAQSGRGGQLSRWGWRVVDEDSEL